MQFREHVLENGLEIIAEVNPQAYSTAIAFFVRAGSRDENDENSGVSHFLEHMAFKGTPTRSAADVNRELDELGSHSNAYTSEEQTCYYATVLPEFQHRAVDLLSDILRPSLRDDDFETEKQVIIEEIHKYDDQPPFGAIEKCMAAHFGSHPLSRSVLGTVASVGGLTPSRMRTYFEQRYSPGNIVLAAAGHVDFEALIESARRMCGAWPRYDAPRLVAPAAAHAGLELMHKEGATQEYIVRIAGGPASEDADRYAGRILATVLGDDSGSRYFWEFVDTGDAECASVGAYEYQGAGSYITFMCCAPEQVQENLARLAEHEQALEAGGITADELALAKNKISAHVVLQAERPSNRLFSIGANWLQRRQYRTVRDSVNAYQAVTLADVSEVIRKHPLTMCTTVAAGPLAALSP
jgi:predicted Zn-dependent peptidase